MIEFANKYARNILFSQNGEEGVLLECRHRIDLRYGHAVEVGGNDGVFCSNIAYLLTHGWGGLFVESDYNLHLRSVANWKVMARESHDNSHLTRPVRHQCCHVDGININAFVDDSCDVLSTDTDGADYEIFRGLKAKPKIIIVEIDSSIPPGDEGFNSDGAAGYRTMTELGIEKGYFLLCHTGNLVFVDNQYRKLFPEIVGDGLSNAHLYFNQSWLKKEAA